MLKEDSKKMRAKDLHELMRAWENYHRIITAEAHLRHIMFREETRYPGFYYRTDFPKLDRRRTGSASSIRRSIRRPAIGR